ncbi:MAG: tetratricopeptide repeat protein [Steroidobacteraceae bacterium]
MSVINKMLQDLDRRNAQAASPGRKPFADVRAIGGARAGAEWFWRVVAALLLVAAAWTVWVIYQLQPRSVVTELAHRAAEDTRRRAVSAAQSRPAPQPVAMKPAAPAPSRPEVVVPQPAPEKLAAPMETLRLALTIDTPLALPVRRAAEGENPVRKAGAAAVRPAPRERAAPPPAAARIEKRARDRLPQDRAENEFRRAAQFLRQGRVVDAEEALLAALEADGAHQPSRQTLIALYIEQGRTDDARAHLEQGLALNPAHSPYAVALARIHVDRGDYSKALGVLDMLGAGAPLDADFYAMRGAILLRMSRHAEAAEAYRLALGGSAQNGVSWVGLGIALSELGRGGEARDAFRHGIATGSLSDDLRAYAEQRVRQLQ